MKMSCCQPLVFTINQEIDLSECCLILNLHGFITGMEYRLILYGIEIFFFFWTDHCHFVEKCEISVLKGRPGNPVKLNA